MTPCDQCDRDRLKQLFNEQLPETVANDVADHVASCLSCQQELELFAAEKHWWTEASQRLSQRSVEVPSLRISEVNVNSGEPDERWSHRESSEQPLPTEDRLQCHFHPLSELPDEAYASDFAVDFLEPSDDTTVLGRLGEYEIVEVIGRGGMGIVLKGFQRELHRFVAVKVLAPHLATSGAARRRFAREAQATAAVVNPHVMAIHSVHANSKLPYLVMPFVDCESLQQRLDRQGPLDLKDILRIGMQGALGLAAAHAQGLVHRDVKPANILLEANVDRVMLTDFGLARAVDDATLTRTGIIAGTPQYMSPEQANGDAVDHRSDLFSLGSVLYAMCTARPPFRAETTFGILRRIRETDPRPVREINADIPAWLEQIVFQLLSKNADERIATATEVASLLEQCLAHVQQPTVVPLPARWITPATRTETTQSKPPRRSFLKSQRLMQLTMMVVAIIIAIPSVGMLVGKITSRSPAKNDSTGDRNDSAAATNTDDPLFDWNQTQVELGETDQSLKELELNVLSESEETPGASTDFSSGKLP